MTGVPPKRLTPDQVEKLVAWREKGRSVDWIAERLSFSPGAVLYQCLKHCAISPRQRGRAPWRGPKTIVAGDGRTQRRFAPDEDARMIELEAEGKPYKQIAREMGRAYTSVRMRLMMLAQHDEIAA